MRMAALAGALLMSTRQEDFGGVPSFIPVWLHNVGHIAKLGTRDKAGQGGFSSEPPGFNNARKLYF